MISAGRSDKILYGLLQQSIRQTYHEYLKVYAIVMFIYSMEISFMVRYCVFYDLWYSLELTFNPMAIVSLLS